MSSVRSSTIRREEPPEPGFTFDKSGFVKKFQEKGHVTFERALPASFLARARVELAAAIDGDSKYHGGTDYQDYGMVLVSALYGGVFWEMFDLPQIVEPFAALLGNDCIVYAHTSTSMPPRRSNYSSRIHRDDSRAPSRDLTKVALLIAVDEFTEENGATWFLEGSHHRAEAPSETEFRATARRFTCPAGTLRFWNPRTWHAGGQNTTAQWRHGMTAVMVPPWMKQRLDFPRLLAGSDLSAISPAARQKLGFQAQVPASYDEYYAPSVRAGYSQRLLP